MRLWLHFFFLFFQYLKACEQEPANDVTSAANFLFLFDTDFSEIQMKRWKKLAKTMACNLPVHEKIQVAVAVKNGSKISIGNWKESSNFTSELESIISFESNLKCPRISMIFDQLGEINHETHLVIPIDSRIECNFEQEIANMTLRNFILLDEIGLGLDKENKSTKKFNIAWSDIDHLESDEDFGRVLGSFSVKLQEAHKIHDKIKSWADTLPKAIETTATALLNSVTTSVETTTGDVNVSRLILEVLDQNEVISTRNTMDLSNNDGVDYSTSTTSKTTESVMVIEYSVENTTATEAHFPNSSLPMLITTPLLENIPTSFFDSATLTASETFETVNPLNSDEEMSENTTTSRSLAFINEELTTKQQQVPDVFNSTESSEHSVIKSTTKEMNDFNLVENNSTEETTTTHAVTVEETSKTSIGMENTTLNENKTDETRTITIFFNSTESNEISAEITSSKSALVNETVATTEMELEDSIILEEEKNTTQTWDNKTEIEEWKWVENKTENYTNVLTEIDGKTKYENNTEEFLERSENTSTWRAPEVENSTISGARRISSSIEDDSTEEVIEFNTTLASVEYRHLTDAILVEEDENPEPQNNKTKTIQTEGESHTTKNIPTSIISFHSHETINITSNLTGVYGEMKVSDEEDGITNDPAHKPWHVLFGERLLNHWLVLVVAAVCILLLIGILIMFFIVGRRGAKKKGKKDEEYKKLGGDLYTAREPSSTSVMESSGETDRLLGDKKENGNQRLFTGLGPPDARISSNDHSRKSLRAPVQPIPHPPEGAVDPYSPIFPSHIEERFSELAITPLKTTSSAFSRRPVAQFPKTTTNTRTVMAMDINDL